MSIRGKRIPVFGKPPVTAGGEDRFVKLLPVQEEVANGRMGILGEWRSRPGYAPIQQLASTAPVVALFAHEGMVAITADGRVFRSFGDNFDEMVEVGTLDGQRRPTLVAFDGALIAADGGDPVEIESSRLRRLGIPTLTPGAPGVEATNKGSIPSGEFEYYVTLTTVAGESTIGPPSSIVTLEGYTPHGVIVKRPDLTEDELRVVLSWSAWRRSLDGDDIRFVGTADADVLSIKDDQESPLGSVPTSNDSGTYPPRFTEACVVGDYLVYAGHDSIEIGWFSPGSRDLAPTAFTTAVQLDGGLLQTVRGVTKDLYVFRTNALDVFSLTGGDDIFARRVTVRRGCMARQSVVLVDNAVPYWLGDDGIFYRLRGAQAESLGVLEQNLIWTLSHPENIEGWDFPRERVIRWFAREDGVCIGYNYAKDHFFRDWSWSDGQIPLDVRCVLVRGGQTFVGLSGGRIATWGDEHTTDDTARIRTIRRFTVPLDDAGRRSKANLLILRHQRGTQGAPAEPAPAWTFPHDYKMGDRCTGATGAAVVYVCTTPYSPTSVSQTPGFGSAWRSNWRLEDEGDDDRSLLVSWGFDQGPREGLQAISSGDPGDTRPFTTIGPLGFGRELWIEIEKPAAASLALTGGTVVANPLGDGGA